MAMPCHAAADQQWPAANRQGNVTIRVGSISQVLNNNHVFGDHQHPFPSHGASPRHQVANAHHPPPNRVAEEGGHRSTRAKTQTLRTAMSYPRKRAVTACQLCRVRKTKCNNARPKCKFCDDSGAECVYEDRSDHSSFDPASLAILEQLNHITQTLDALTPNAVTSGASSVAGHLSNHPQSFKPPNTFAHPTATSPDPHQDVLTATAGNDYLDDEYMHIPSSRTCPDTILCWPIFKGRYALDCLGEVLFEAKNDHDSDEDMVDPSSTRTKSQRGRIADSGVQGFREEHVVGLVERFISLVHIKNPILDVESLRQYARSVAENGLAWDGRSCLVLLACTLGSIAQPFDPVQGAPSLNSMETGNDSLADFKQDLLNAESYYIMARKRIGLLKTSIIRSQCYFWSGVYLMYILQPLDAWQNFLQASNTCHIYLKGTMKMNKHGRAAENKTRQLEQRLFWSCFKSECEIRIELSLPESGIETIKYPDMFPNPPAMDSPAAGENADPCFNYRLNTPSSYENLHRSQHHALSLNQTQEQSWFYYLTEIALRRIGNRILNTFYKDDRFARMPISAMIELAKDFEAQCLQWYSSLPSAIQFDLENLKVFPTGELPSVVCARFLEIRFWIYRPFLFYAVHHSPDDPFRATIQPFVNKALECTFCLVTDLPSKHRHHGTWLGLRASTGAAFILIAAIMCGHLEVPEYWETCVLFQINKLRYWENESPDIKRARCILIEIFSELGQVSL